MTWSHCSNAEIADTVDCPSCGLSKASWTVTVNATRTFVVAQRGRAGRKKTAWLELELSDGAGAAVELELPDGRVVERRLDAAGALREEGLYPGECRVRFPGRTVAWVGADAERAVHAADDAGWITCETERRHGFEARAAGARLVWPAAGEHVQWVNLAPHPDHPDRGSRLVVRVSAPAGGRAFARVVAAEGNSRRDRPRPGVVGLTPDADGVVELGLADGGEARLELELGLAGGDVFDVRVGATRACDDAAVTVTNWRRLHYQLTRSAEHAVSDLPAARAAFARVFVDLQRTRELVLGPDHPGTPPGAWLTQADLPAEDPPRPPGPRLVFGNHDQHWFDGLFDADQAPAPCAHLVVVDGVYDGGRPGHPHRQTLEFTLTAPEDPGRSIQNAEDYDLLPTAVQDGRHCLIEGAWTSEAPAGHPDHGRTGVVRPQDLTIKWRTKVLVRLDGITPGDGAPPPGQTVTDAATQHPVRVRLLVHVALGPTEGRSTGQQVAIVFTPRADWLQAVVVHELGHALRQVGTVEPPGLRFDDHGRIYKDKWGHRGPHCAHGLTEEEFRPYRKPDAAGTCVMWGAKDESRAPNLDFCERCAPFVRADHCMTLGFTFDDPPVREG